MTSTKQASSPIKKRSSIPLAYLTALRPRQWTKNLIVFAAPLFAFEINLSTFLACLFVFILFCAISSSFYLFNDIIDVEADRQHPVKSKRPIAAGIVPIKIALGLALFLCVGSIILGGWWSEKVGITLLGYAILQIAYNAGLKRTVILDVMAIATGFVLRAYAGAAVTDIVLSHWFLVCTAMLALFLAIEKRKAELHLASLNGKSTRRVLQHYSTSLLNRMENIVTTGTILTYTLWSAGPNLRGASTSWMLLTIPLVMYGVFRYQFLSDPEVLQKQWGESSDARKTERPEEVLLKDLPMLLTVLGWIVAVFMILSLKHKNLIS